MNAPVLYYPNFVPDPDLAFKELNESLDWDRRDGVRRDEFYFNDTDVAYTYGTSPYDRTYLPETEWHSKVLNIRILLEAYLDCILDVCFLNRYLNAGDHLGWHADDSPEMDPKRPIVTVSLGAVRDIQFRCPDYNTDIESLTLGHGSAAVMSPGMQQTHQHRIPKSSQSNIGTRISLTYRGYIS